MEKFNIFQNGKCCFYVGMGTDVCVDVGVDVGVGEGVGVGWKCKKN